MTPLDNARLANCEIRSSLGHGNGTFIAPNLVLAAWHTISETSELTFTTTHDMLTQAASNGRIFRVSPYDDLVIVHLDEPIGRHIAAAITPMQAIYQGRHQRLLTRFNGVAADHDVIYNPPLIVDFEGRDDAPRDLFSTDGYIGYGYSGSPVINAAGRLVSVVLSGFDDNDRPSDPELLQKTLREQDGRRFFLGPRPQNLAAFVEQAKLAL